mgnify:CR=1 FL=1
MTNGEFVSKIIRDAHDQRIMEEAAIKAAKAKRVAMFSEFASIVADLIRRGGKYHDWKKGTWRLFVAAGPEELVLPFGDRTWRFYATDGGICCDDPHYGYVGMPPFFFKTAREAGLWLMGMGPSVSRVWPSWSDAAMPAARVRIGAREYQYGVESDRHQQ